MKEHTQAQNGGQWMCIPPPGAGRMSARGFNPCMVFGSVGPVFIFYPNKNNMIHYFFKLRLIGFGSFSAKNIYQTKFSLTAHRNPPLHIYITYRVFRSTGPGANKSLEIVGPVYLKSVLLLSGSAVSVCVCVCVYMNMCVYVVVCESLNTCV